LSVDAGHVECSVSTGTSTSVQIYIEMLKQYIYSKHTIDVIILESQRPVAAHNTDFTLDFAYADSVDLFGIFLAIGGSLRTPRPPCVWLIYVAQTSNLTPADRINCAVHKDGT